MTLLKSLCISFSIYSKIPMPQFAWKEEDMRYTLCFFPWVGAVIGALVWFWLWICNRLGFNMFCYLLFGTAIPLLVTGGFHVDGFMDTMDAFHSYQPKERKLEILKDSHIGAFAAIMLVLYYLIYMAGFSQISSKSALAVFCMGFYLSRIFSGIGVVSFRSAKSDGMLYLFASSAQEKVVKGSLYVQMVLCFVLMGLVSWRSAALVIPAAVLCLIYYRRRSYKELGGITGDTAGYFVTICECAMAVAAAVGSLIGG